MKGGVGTPILLNISPLLKIGRDYEKILVWR